VSDYYEVLGVSRQATTDEIKRAYKKKARRLHPDVAGPGHEDEFKAINVAYEVLADSDKRQMYDLGGEEAVHADGGFNAGGFGAADFGGFGDFLGGLLGDLRHDTLLEAIEVALGDAIVPTTLGGSR